MTPLKLKWMLGPAVALGLGCGVAVFAAPSPAAAMTAAECRAAGGVPVEDKNTGNIFCYKTLITAGGRREPDCRELIGKSPGAGAPPPCRMPQTRRPDTAPQRVQDALKRN